MTKPDHFHSVEDMEQYTADTAYLATLAGDAARLAAFGNAALGKKLVKLLPLLQSVLHAHAGDGGFPASVCTAIRKWRADR